MRSLTCCIVFLFGLTIVGCGGEMGSGAKSEYASDAMEESYNAPAGSQGGELDLLDEEVGADQVGQAGEANPQIPPEQIPPEQIQRQIIYTAQLSLVVEEFGAVPQQVEQLASKHGGFIAGSSLQGSSGSPRSGSWTIRIPVRQYGTFLDAAKGLGEFQSLTTESQEVTAEFYDVKTRIENKQRQEKRLLDLLQEATGKLEEVLKVEEQLARVREEIERMQGRMRVLKDLTAYSTITLTVQEIKGYQPPEAPTFGNRVSRAWSGTLTALYETGQNLVIGIVTVGPWLVVLSIPVILFIGVIRMLVRKRVLK